MAMTTDELAAVRTYVVWDPPTDADLHAEQERLGGTWAAALAAMRTRYSVMLNDPSSFTISGEYGESRSGESLKHFAGLIDEVAALAAAEAAGDDTPTIEPMTSGQLVREPSSWSGSRGRRCRGSFPGMLG